MRCAVLCCAVLCRAVLCCAVPCCAVPCCAVLCCAVLCCAVLCCAVDCVMVLQAMRVLKPGGLLMTCSCSGAVTLDDHFIPALKVSQLQKQSLQTVIAHRYCILSAADDIGQLSLSGSGHTPCPLGCSFVSHFLSGLLWLHACYKQTLSVHLARKSRLSIFCTNFRQYSRVPCKGKYMRCFLSMHAAVTCNQSWMVRNAAMYNAGGSQGSRPSFQHSQECREWP